MADYCTQGDILDAMDESDVILYTDDDDTGGINTDAVAKAITGASALIDARIGAKYTVPLAPIPEIIKETACDIALYKISSRRGQAPEEYRNKYTDAVKFLKDLASGNSVIPDATPATSTVSADSVVFTSDTRMFSRDKLKGW